MGIFTDQGRLRDRLALRRRLHNPKRRATLIMSKLRSKNKIAKHRIEVLEKRVQDLVGMNDELEHMISQYEREEVVFREVPKHLQLDETF